MGVCLLYLGGHDTGLTIFVSNRPPLDNSLSIERVVMFCVTSTCDILSPIVITDVTLPKIAMSLTD